MSCNSRTTPNYTHYLPPPPPQKIHPSNPSQLWMQKTHTLFATHTDTRMYEGRPLRNLPALQTKPEWTQPDSEREFLVPAKQARHGDWFKPSPTRGREPWAHPVVEEINNYKGRQGTRIPPPRASRHWWRDGKLRVTIREASQRGGRPCHTALSCCCCCRGGAGSNRWRRSEEGKV